MPEEPRWWVCLPVILSAWAAMHLADAVSLAASKTIIALDRWIRRR